MFLAVAAQAQWWPYNGYAGYAGYSGYYNNFYNYPYNTVDAKALPTTYATGYPYYAAAYPAYSANQYHSQDELGQASFGYAHPGQAAVNYRDAAGNQVGSYAYINPEGKEVRVSYTADHRGFRVISNDLPVGPSAPEVEASALPEPVQDTPEVAEAKAAHLAAHAAIKAGIFPEGPVAPEAPAVEMPVPVQDTEEVAQAKADFAKAYAEAAAAAAAAPEEAASRKKRQILGYPYAFAHPYAAYPFAAPVAVAPGAPFREATLTKTVLNPGHAVAYRVD